MSFLNYYITFYFFIILKIQVENMKKKLKVQKPESLENWKFKDLKFVKQKICKFDNS